MSNIYELDNESIAKGLDLDVPIIGNIIERTHDCFYEFIEDRPFTPNDMDDLIRAAIIVCGRRWLENGNKNEIKYEEGKEFYRLQEERLRNLK